MRYFAADDPHPLFGPNGKTIPERYYLEAHDSPPTKVGIHRLLAGYGYIEASINGYQSAKEAKIEYDGDDTKKMNPRAVIGTKYFADVLEPWSLEDTSIGDIKYTSHQSAIEEYGHNGYDDDGNDYDWWDEEVVPDFYRGYFPEEEEQKLLPQSLMLSDPIVSPGLSDDEAAKVLENFTLSLDTGGDPYHEEVTIHPGFREMNQKKQRPTIMEFLSLAARWLILDHEADLDLDMRRKLAAARGVPMVLNDQDNERNSYRTWQSDSLFSQLSPDESRFRVWGLFPDCLNEPGLVCTQYEYYDLRFVADKIGLCIGLTCRTALRAVGNLTHNQSRRVLAALIYLQLRF